jgi:hypothetical protein
MNLKKKKNSKSRKSYVPTKHGQQRVHRQMDGIPKQRKHVATPKEPSQLPGAHPTILEHQAQDRQTQSAKINQTRIHPVTGSSDQEPA